MKYFIAVICLSLHSMAFGQHPLYQEAFEFSVRPIKGGETILFNGKSHAFTFEVASNKIVHTENPNYFTVGSQVIQANIIPLPESSLDLTRLTTEQQKEALEGYVAYEWAYFNDELKLGCQNLKKEWKTIEGRLWLLWTFDVKIAATGDVSKVVKRQLFASTLCFNQVLDLNAPLMKGDSEEMAQKLIDGMMLSLKLFNERK